MPSPTRRHFLQRSTRWLAAGSFASIAAATARAQDFGRLPAIEADLVREAVGSSHGNFDRLRELVASHPTLVNAAWDWGGGDFETPLQAAAHTGRRGIAEYLLAHGARLDVFAAAMLGQLEFVKACFALDPTLDRIHGPHGFTLHHCATQGGELAAPVVAYLESIGASTDSKRPLPFA